jgi:NDP-sugar pyrophosphorylase family protein
MILAAGFGTRLGALTQIRPKPMLPICGTPLVRWSVLWLRAHGVRDIVINLHHLGEQIEADLGDGTSLGVHVHYTHEEGMILGTGGGLRNARSLLDDGSGAPIVVVNGKTIFDLDLGAVLGRHRALGSEATMVLRPDAEGIWGGSLAAGSDGRLATFLGRTRPGVEPGPPLMFTGIHVMEPRFLDRVPAEGEQCIVRTAYRSLFEEGGGPGTFVTEGYWWEHSTPERYRQGVWNLLEGRADLEHREHPLRGVHPTVTLDDGARVDGEVFIGPGAHIEAGARVVGPSQIGAGAVVKAGSRLERCIVWPGSVAQGEQYDAVIAEPRA